MIVTKVICDKCKTEVNDGAWDDITIIRDDCPGMFNRQDKIQLCRKCYKEFLKDYLGEEADAI